METLQFKYQNWQGEIKTRTVVPIHFWFGSTKFHSEEQWFLKAIDIEKSAERDFAAKDIIKFL